MTNQPGGCRDRRSQDGSRRRHVRRPSFLQPDFGPISEWPVIHPEHVPEAICIPQAPDASASTLPARAPCAGCGAHFDRQVNELLHEEAYFLNHPPSCDDAAHGEV